MLPATYDFTIVRGNNLPVTFRLMAGEPPEPVELTGTTVVLAMAWRGGRLDKSSADGGLTVDVAAGEVTWRPSIAESRALPEGRLTRYELELRAADGSERTLLAGFITGFGGLADD